MAASDRSARLTGPEGRIATALQRRIMALHAFIYRLSGGAIWGRMFNSPVLLLLTIGRKTGRLRTTPLLYLADGETLVIVASNGGAPRDPIWWRNLQHYPEALVQVGRRVMRVRAAQATPAEHERLWPLLTAMYPSYADYQARTSRPIPVAVLRPVEE